MSPRVVADETARHAAAFGATDWLSLAAAPTFAVMALLTGVFGGEPDSLCAALQGMSPLSGMIPMYLLMSAFHLAPWLNLRNKRAGAHALILETSRARPP